MAHSAMNSRVEPEFIGTRRRSSPGGWGGSVVNWEVDAPVGSRLDSGEETLGPVRHSAQMTAPSPAILPTPSRLSTEERPLRLLAPRDSNAGLRVEMQKTVAIGVSRFENAAYRVSAAFSHRGKARNGVVSIGSTG